MANDQHRSRRASVSTGKRSRFPVLCVLVLTALAVGLWVFASAFPRLEVAGCRITQEEYLLAMYQARDDVLSKHAAAGISLTDWSDDTALGDPVRLTMERALDILSEYYAVSLLAVERGYLTDAGYDAMRRDMEEVNRQRQEALDSGTMITGFRSFTTEDFLTYRASGIRLQFCSDPHNPEYHVTPEELRQRYEADLENLYQKPDSLELAFLAADASPREADDLEQAFLSLRQLALETGDLAAALEEMPQLNDYYQEISVDPGSYSVYTRSHSDILACAAGLQSGDLSRVFRQDDRLCLVQCLRRTAHPPVPLEDVRSVVVESVRESRYDALIAERMENMEIQGDLRWLYRFTAEQLR